MFLISFNLKDIRQEIYSSKKGNLITLGNFIEDHILIKNVYDSYIADESAINLQHLTWDTIGGTKIHIIYKGRSNSCIFDLRTLKLIINIVYPKERVIFGYTDNNELQGIKINNCEFISSEIMPAYNYMSELKFLDSSNILSIDDIIKCRVELINRYRCDK